MQARATNGLPNLNWALSKNLAGGNVIPFNYVGADFAARAVAFPTTGGMPLYISDAGTDEDLLQGLPHAKVYRLGQPHKLTFPIEPVKAFA